MTDISHLVHLVRQQFRPWREIALLMLMVMEVSWVAPWFRSLTPATYAIHPFGAFLVLLCMMLFSHMTARLMETLHIRQRIRRWVTVGLLVISILIGLRVLLYPHEQVGLMELLNRPLRSMMDWRSIIPDEFIIILAVLIGWWRGISLSQEYVEPTSVMGYFRTGIIMFLVYVVVNTLVTGETPGGFLYVFLFASLISMAAARMSVLNTLRGGRPSIFDRRWFGGILFAAISVVLLAIGLGETFGGNLNWFTFIVMGIFGLFAVIAWAVITPVLALVIYLVRNTQGDTEVVQKLSESLNQIQHLMQGFLQKIAGTIGQPDLLAVLRILLTSLRTILLWGVILAVAAGILIWVVMQIRKDRQRRILDEEQQSILAGGDLLRMLQAFLRQRWESLVDGVANAVDLRRRLRARAAARVRQIYSDLLELAEELGCSRQEAQTPLEFLPALERTLPGVADELEHITNAYVKVRYGQLPEDNQELVSIESAWNKVDEAGKQKLAELEHKKSPPSARSTRGAVR